MSDAETNIRNALRTETERANQQTKRVLELEGMVHRADESIEKMDIQIGALIAERDSLRAELISKHSGANRSDDPDVEAEDHIAIDVAVNGLLSIAKDSADHLEAVRKAFSTLRAIGEHPHQVARRNAEVDG